MSRKRKVMNVPRINTGKITPRGRNSSCVQALSRCVLVCAFVVVASVDASGGEVDVWVMIMASINVAVLGLTVMRAPREAGRLPAPVRVVLHDRLWFQFLEECGIVDLSMPVRSDQPASAY